MDELLKLAERVEDFDRRLKSIASNDRLSPGGQTQAVALLTSLNAGMFPKLAAALRARAQQGEG